MFQYPIIRGSDQGSFVLLLKQKQKQELLILLKLISLMNLRRREQMNQTDVRFNSSFQH